MAEPCEFTRHIEAYVNTSSSPTEQAAHLKAIVYLLKNGHLTLEAMVRQMELYLTTTDAIIRARGILLLGDVLSCLSSMPFDEVTIHSLITCFTERLADWIALRGALVGCLALMRRVDQVGRVSNDDAKAVLGCFLQSLHVQSLGQHDRRLCFEILECLLENYSNAVIPLGNQVIDGICEAVDMEKDPQCLVLAFHIVELVTQLFPDPDGPVACVAEELFEILGRYFPIHFTHERGEDLDVTRDSLSRSLMLAFSSTSLFEPFAVPLLLEKLSSDLQSAKIDALMYLGHCSVKYGPERMAKHAEAIWPLLKEAIFSSQGSAFSFSPESLESPEHPRNVIAREALTFLETVLRQNVALYLELILNDSDVNLIIKDINSYKNYNKIPLEEKQRVNAVGCILAASAKASIASCNRVFESTFPCLLEALGIFVRDPSMNHPRVYEHLVSEEINFGALFLSVLLLEAYRDQIVSSKIAHSVHDSKSEACPAILVGFSAALLTAVSSTLVRNDYQEACSPYIYLSVKGLQIYATFPGDVLPVDGNLFEDILTKLVSIVTKNFKHQYQWNLALKSLINIGSYIHKYNQSAKVPSYMAIVIEEIVSLLTTVELEMPYPLKLKAVSDIGMIGMNYMLRIFQGIEAALFTDLSNFYIHGNTKSAENTMQLLQCYSKKILPWMEKCGGSDQVLLQFVVGLLNQIEGWKCVSSETKKKEVTNATMEAVKCAVGSCLETSQNIIVEKTWSMLSSSSYFSVNEYSTPATVGKEGFLLAHDLKSLPAKEELVLSLFASVTIALRPTAHLPNVRAAIHLFRSAFLMGHIPSAQALGSILNKLCSRTNGERGLSDFFLEEAIDLVFSHSLVCSDGKCPEESNMSLSAICHAASTNKSLQTNVLVGLAWIGKGLLMRGHEKLKDITVVFLDYMLHSDGRPTKQGSVEEEKDRSIDSSAAKYAADSFQILMSDAEDCLNRRYHATMRPLYKQRFFSTMIPILQPLIMKCDSSLTRYFLYCAFTHVVCESPIIAVLGEAKKLIPLVVDALVIFSKDEVGKDMMYRLLLVLSGILTDSNGQEAAVENAPMITNCLVKIIAYPHMMLVRETGVQCLVAMSALPHSRIYPLRTQVLQAISRVLDDPKRAVRVEAVRCRQAWLSSC